MSERWLVRQPVRDREDQIVGYEMLYHGENQAFHSERDGDAEYAMADTLCGILNKSNVKALGKGVNFMTFSTTLLMRKVPRMFEKDNLVIQIDDSVVVHPLSMHFVEQYAEQGYEIAVNEFEFSSRYMSMMDSISYIKADVTRHSEEALRNLVEIARVMKKKCIMTQIETEKQYRMVYSMGADFFEGPYVTGRLRWNPKDSSHLGGEFFQLLRELAKDSPSSRDLETRIASNPIYSYCLLKLACSQYFGFQERPTTVHQALAAVGADNLKHWAYLLNVVPAQADDGFSELIQLSLMRAKFYQELMRCCENIPMSMEEGYLTGMFSTLSRYVDVPQREALQELLVPGVIQRALTDGAGPERLLYELMCCYERGQWQQVGELSQKLKISDKQLLKTYFLALSEVGAMWEKLNKPFSDEKDRAE